MRVDRNLISHVIIIILTEEEKHVWQTTYLELIAVPTNKSVYIEFVRICWESIIRELIEKLTNVWARERKMKIVINKISFSNGRRCHYYYFYTSWK